jgi:MarR family transcriptional regulator, organic hydroperoxide resistance regulator
LEIKFNYMELIGYQIIKGEVLIKRKLLSLFTQKGYDLTFEQWTILNILYKEQGLIQSDIAERTYKDKTNVTRILDVLEKKSYISRKNHSKDRRSSCIFLTKSGLDMFKDLIPYVKKLNQEFGRGISSDEMVLFTNILSRICTNIEA